MSMLSVLSSFSLLLAQQYTTSYDSSSSGDAAAGFFGLAMCCCFGVFGVVAMAFWVWMLIDCATKDFPGENDKLIWILVIVLAGAPGALIYFFVAKDKGTKR